MKKYIDKIHERINRLEYENEEKSAKEIFLESAMTCISEVVNTTELVLTSYDNEYLKIRVDGYDVLKDDELILFISDYSNVEQELSDRELKAYQRRICNYVINAQEGLSKDLNEGDNIRIISDFIYSKQDTIKKIHLYVVSSREYTGQTVAEMDINSINVDTKVFDATYLKELGFLHEVNEDEIVINFIDPVSYVKCEDTTKEMDIYLMFVKGKDIALAYEKYGYLMLEGNVRAYLKKTNKQNKGILETIEREPQYFVSYNNGLSTVANSIVIENDKIKSINGWKIVNGGQTTASIYEAYKENKGNLNKEVFVPVKLTILKDTERPTELVSRIAEYANTQSKVSQSDLNSNEGYHLEIEKLSRTMCVPTKVAGKELRKWYYERLRGQYNLERERSSSKEGFEAEYSPRNVFDKMDLAKAVMMWEQEPFTTAMGKENCFGVFGLRTKVNEGQYKIDENYYKNVIALIILYRSIVEIVKRKKYGGFGSNIVEYTGSVISMLSGKKLNLEMIWNDQKISKKLENIIDYITDDVVDIITDTPADQKNVQMYCRQPRCWETVKSYDYEIDFFDELLGDDVITILSNNSTTVVDGNEVDINTLDAAYWGEMSKWGKDTGLLTPSERTMAFSACKIARTGYQWKSDKQRDFAKSIYIKAIKNGFEYKGE